MSIKSRENKALLWQLLSDHPFQKTDPKKFQAVFEYRINEVYNQRFHYKNNLMDMNKEVIRQFASEIANKSQTTNHKQNNRVSSTISTSSTNNTNNNTFNKLPDPQDSKDYSKINMFEQRLKAQQDNFNALIHKNKPKEIDFSDKAEDTPIDSRMVDNTLQQREAELKKIMNQYNTNGQSQKWLESQSTSKRLEKEQQKEMENNTKNPKHLMIDKQSENIKLEPDFVFTPEENTHSQNAKQQRRVRFNIDSSASGSSTSSPVSSSSSVSSSVSSSASTILNKLKKVGDDNTQVQNTNINSHSNFALLKDIQNDIKSLIVNQTMIISILNSMQQEKNKLRDENKNGDKTENEEVVLEENDE